MEATNEKNTMCGSEKDKLVERAWKALVDTGMSEEEIMRFAKFCQKAYDKGIRLEDIAISLEAPLETNLKISEDQNRIEFEHKEFGQWINRFSLFFYKTRHNYYNCDKCFFSKRHSDLEPEALCSEVPCATVDRVDGESGFWLSREEISDRYANRIFKIFMWISASVFSILTVLLLLRFIN